MLTSLNWLIYALCSTLLYGFWGFFSKLATNHMNSYSILIYETCGSILVALFVLVRLDFKPQVEAWGIIYAFLIGIFGVLATLFFLLAVSHGKVSVVITLTALYPVVSILLAAVILKESITMRQGLGIALAIAAMLLFASE
ncbi:EamA family transporter [Nostoc sp. FACHB-152]|uniref:EamA family transporter n=1 Tax=unclassified Nostoc TaxID=2593658 RepID=UPI0016860112|nr:MULTISPECIES: EamA family transporter [unclassified Nostoc]MBD2449613.1 EamA family transporter [Nostoc sp. FACHB-152]MBD2468980.1 EamA family transporter [Nostoc sp. FACHB-145]